MRVSTPTSGSWHVHWSSNPALLSQEAIQHILSFFFFFTDVKKTEKPKIKVKCAKELSVISKCITAVVCGRNLICLLLSLFICLLVFVCLFFFCFAFSLTFFSYFILTFFYLEKVGRRCSSAECPDKAKACLSHYLSEADKFCTCSTHGIYLKREKVCVGKCYTFMFNTDATR